jgi:hypothetical protein
MAAAATAEATKIARDARATKSMKEETDIQKAGDQSPGKAAT